MKHTIIIPSLLITIFSVVPAGASNACTCNGLAANFPGYGLVCSNKVVELTPFLDGDESLALRVCEGEMDVYLNGSRQPDGSCHCEKSPFEVVLKITNSSETGVLHNYEAGVGVGGADIALGNCDRQLAELVRAEVCE